MNPYKWPPYSVLVVMVHGDSFSVPEAVYPQEQLDEAKRLTEKLVIKEYGELGTTYRMRWDVRHVEPDVIEGWDLVVMDVNYPETEGDRVASLEAVPLSPDA